MTLITVTDDFNRSDRWLGAATESWVASNSTYPTVTSNQCATGATNTGIAMHTSQYAGAQSAQFTIKTLGSATSKCGLYAGVENNSTAPGSTYNWTTGAASYRFLAKTSQYLLQKKAVGTGTWTTIGTIYAVAPAVNDVMKITYDPATGIVQGLVNASVVCSYTDPSPVPTTQTRVGVNLESGTIVDDFVATWNAPATWQFYEWQGGTAPAGSAVALTAKVWNSGTAPTGSEGTLNMFATAEQGTDGSGLPLVQPIWSDIVNDSAGVNVHYKFSDTAGGKVYQYVDQCTAYVLDVGWRHVRDRIVLASENTEVYNNQQKHFGLLYAGGTKIHLSLSRGTTDGWWNTTAADHTQYWAVIAAHPEYYSSVGGPNEPNGSPSPPSNWPGNLLTQHQRIFNARAAAGLTSIPIVAAALQDYQKSHPELQLDINAVAAQNIGQFVDRADFHRYPLAKNSVSSGKVSTTSGSATVTAAGGSAISFAPGNVGLMITIRGAGPSGSDLNAQIITVNSTTSVVISTTASSTGASRDCVVGDPEWNYDTPWTQSSMGGRGPDFLMNLRQAWYNAAWGTTQSDSTEGGYNTNLAVTAGGEHIPDAVDAIYKTRHLLCHVLRGIRRWFVYELLDDPDPGLNSAEAHRGQVFTPSLNPQTWTPKPAYYAMKSLLALTNDRDTSGTYTRDNPYIPPKVRLSVTCADPQFKQLLVAKRNGEVRLFYWIEKALWDTVANVQLPVVSAAVTVVTSSGTSNLTATSDAIQSLVLT